MARFISIIHILCLLFLVLGFLLPISFVYWHLISIPLIIIQWWVNDNQCILTQLQKKFEKVKTPEETLEGNFTRDLLFKIGIKMTDTQIQWLIYLVLIVSWCLSLKKLL